MSSFDRKPIVVNNNTSGGIGFAGLLTIVFIILKLTGVIAWSWWWVLAPLWIGFAFWAVVIVFILILAVISAK